MEIVNLITETATKGLRGREQLWCGEAGQRDDSHPRRDGARALETSLCFSEWHAI